MTRLAPADLLAIMAGAVAGMGMFLFLVAMRGLPPRQPAQGHQEPEHPGARDRTGHDREQARGGQRGHQTLRPGA